MTNKNSETPFENIHSRIVDFADNTFLGDKRTLEEIRKDRQQIIDEAKRKQEEATEELKKTTTSKVLRGAISGPIKAVNETVEFADDIYDHFAGNPYDNNDLIDLKEIGLEVEGDKEDWTYTMPQAVSQFLIPMGLVSGTTRKVITNPWVRGAVAGAVADFVVQDPYEENLFNMLDNHPTLANPITDLLKAKTEEEIGVAEARLRQAAGGMVIGETLTGLIRGAGKGFTKLSKETQKRILTRLTNDQNTKLVYAANDDIDKLGDEIIPNVPLTQRQIRDRLADFDIEQATIAKKLSQIGPSIEDARKLGKQEEFRELAQRNFDIGNERTLLKKQQATAPTGKISERLRENLKNVAQSDARALKETDEVLQDATKATGRQKILPGTAHPTIPGKVRGYDGRWVTKKHFEQVTESIKGANEIRAQFDQPVRETVIPDSPRIGTEIPRGETAQSGAVFIERVDKGTGQTGPIAKAFNLPRSYDLAVLELQELNATQLAELGIKKADIAKLTPRQTINLLKKNFDNVRKDLLPGEYRMEGYSESRRKLYKKWFKDDSDVIWVDRQTGKASTIDDEMSIPYLTVKEPTFEEWVKNPPEEYKALFKEIEETSKSAKENIARSKQLFKEIKSGLDEQDKLLKEGSQYDQLSPTDQKKVDLEVSLRGNAPQKLDLTTDTRGKGEFYHGAADEFELDSSSHYAERGLYGQGLYTTDDLVTAGKYQKKNKKIVKADAKETIYKITEKQPVKFYDLDQSTPANLIEELEKISSQNEYYDELIGRTLDDLNIGSWNKSINKNPSLSKIFDELKAQNRSNEIMPMDSLDNIISDVESKLRDQGFGGFTHQGGKKAGKGKRLHQVKIYWDPQDQLNVNKVDVGGGGGAVPPRKPPSGSSGADVPPVDPTDPKVQTTFNPKFVVNNLILEEAEKIKIADASGQWPLKRTFKDISNKANKQTIQKTIATATEFNKEYGRTGDKDLAATVVAMNRLLNKNAQDLHRLSTSMSQSLDAKNIESFKSIRTDFENQIAIIDGLITLNKPLKTIPAQTLAANKIGGGVADTAATIDDLAKRTPTDKAVNQASDLRGVVDEGSEETIKDETFKELLDLVEKGDKAAIKQVRVLTNRLQALSGNPEGLRRMMAEGIPLKALRVFNEVWINNILSGPATHAVNILSTGMNTIARPFDQIIGAGSIHFRKDINIGFKESLFKNRGNLTFNPHFDTKKAVRGGKELIYLMSSIGDSLKMARAAFRIEDNITDPGRMIQDGGSRFAIRHDGEGAIAGLVNGFGSTVRLSGRLLLSEDEFFKSLNFRAYTKASAWENGVNKGLKGKELTDYIQDQFDRTIAIVNTGSMKNTKSIEIAELYEKAKQYAADVTFTSDLQPGSLGSKVQNLASHPVARQFLPFVRTPMNIFKAQVRRTPGFNLMLQEYRQALKSSDTAVAARARGEMITGGALWSVGALVAGNIDDDFAEFTFTGGGPKDFDLLNQRKETGWQPYSFRTILKDKDGNIKMGKDGKPRYKYVSFKRFEPWASHLMLMADFASIIGQLHPQDRMDVGTAISAAIGRNLTDKTYLQGITELGYLLSDFDYGQKWLARRAAQTIVPFSGLAKTVSKTLDPRIKDTRPKAGDEEMLIIRQFFNELKATVHGYGDLKPLRNFITGSIIDYPPGFGPDIFNFMNPIRETKSRNHAVLTVLDDVGIIIPKPSDTIKPIQTGGIQIEGGIKLDHNQYADYLKEIASIKGSDGITLVRALYNKMQNPQIKVLISTAKGEDITGENQDTSVELREIARDTLDSEFKEIIARYKDAARKSFLRKNPDILVDYEKLRAELNNKFQQSSLEKLEKLTGVSN